MSDDNLRVTDLRGEYPLPRGWRPKSIGERRRVEDGRISRDGVPLPRAEEEKIKRRLLADVSDQHDVVDPTAIEHEKREYLPGLMGHGTSPGLVAPKGWGKTKFLCALAAALLIPRRRFLDFFAPAQMTEEERRRDVWLLNAETPVAAVHAELLRNGLQFGYRDGTPCYFSLSHEEGNGVLIVEHLVQTEPAEFDLTDEAKFAYWADRLGSIGNGPLTVIADGVTAMLGGQTNRTGEWTSRFKALLKECDISNGLGVMHSNLSPGVVTPMEGVESMNQWDGMWYGSSPRFPIRSSDSRFFEVIARLGDADVPKRQVVMDENGLLKLVDGEAREASKQSGPTREENLLMKLAEAGGPMWTKQVCGEGDEYANDKKALEALAESGRVVKQQVQDGRTRGMTWSLSTALDEPAVTE